ncbi:MAG: carboxymuconolactone decarboxylase family protein [Myxococcota bacterium]
MQQARSEGEIIEGGRDAVARFAPAAAIALGDLEAVAWRRVDADLLDLAARVIAGIQAMPALARPAACGASPWQGRDVSGWPSFGDLRESWKGALAFAEQFTLDVSAIDDDLREGLSAALGPQAAEFAQAIYVADVVARARFALDRLFGASGRGAASPGTETQALKADATIWNGIEELIRVVPGLQGLDPVTTELVRLRGARAHHCRVCQSVRSRSAMVAGANDDTFAAVDFYKESDLPEAIKAALAFTDAFIWTPGRIADDEIAALRAHYTPAQQVELVLDIVRNASNKFAVAMAADGANVSEGYEIYDVKPDGSIEYGLSAP